MSLSRPLTRITRTCKPCAQRRTLQTPFLNIRSFGHSSQLSYPRKDAQDKDSINTEASEYSKSGTDDAAARADSTAFDPDTTSPEAQHEQEGGNVSNQHDSASAKVLPPFSEPFFSCPFS